MISTITRRASNCSERLRTKSGQSAAPGMISRSARHHLAAVARAERERVAAREERSNSSRARALKRIGLGPALARAEHVAVGEAAAGGEALEARERDAAGDDVGHVHVDRLEAGAVEGRGHLDLAVHALLAQDGDARPRAAATKGAMSSGIEGQCTERPGSSRSMMRSYSSRAHVRVVAQRLHAPAGLGPGALQVVALGGEHRAVVARDADLVARVRPPIRSHARQSPAARSAAMTARGRRRGSGARRPAPRRRAREREVLRAPGELLFGVALERVDVVDRGSKASASRSTVTPQWPAKAISHSVAKRPPSERSW